MMIEVVPFYHAIVGTLQHHISDDETLVATTMFAFAMSTVLTGLAFATLGYFKLGRLSEFFPRHILVGTIGGVGAFLLVTGLEVSTRTEETDGFSLELLKRFFSASVLPLWVRQAQHGKVLGKSADLSPSLPADHPARARSHPPRHHLEVLAPAHFPSLLPLHPGHLLRHHAGRGRFSRDFARPRVGVRGQVGQQQVVRILDTLR